MNYKNKPNKKTSWKPLFFIFIFLLTGEAVLADKKINMKISMTAEEIKSQSQLVSEAKMFEGKVDLLTPSKIESLTQLIHESGKRKPADYSSLKSELETDKEYTEFITQLKAIKNTSDIENVLNWLEPKLALTPDNSAFAATATKSLSLRFIGSQFLPLRAYKAVIYRMVPLLAKVEPKAVHSAILSNVMQLNSLIQNFLPQPRWKSLFNYLAEPPSISATEGSAIGRFKSLKEIKERRFSFESQVQYFLFTEALPALSLARTRLSLIEADIKSSSGVVWDNSLFHSSDSLPKNTEDLYVRLTLPDYFGAAASIDSSIGNIYFLNSYRLDGYFNLLGYLAQLYGFDGYPDLAQLGEDLSFANITSSLKAAASSKEEAQIILRSALITGGSAKVRKAVFDKFRAANPGLNVLKRIEDKANFDARMEKAFVYYKDSFNCANLAWQAIHTGNTSNSDISTFVDLTNPQSRIIDRGMTNFENMLEGRQFIQSTLTSEQVKVSLHNFLVTEKVDDLYELLPTAFDVDKENTRVLEKTVGGKETLAYRNYDYGRSTGWNKVAYKKIFPELTNGKDDLRMHIRVLNQVWGGGLASLPLSAVMF